MKQRIIIAALMAFFCIIASADELKQGDSIVKSLELEFDEQSNVDDVFISWELSGDWDKFDYSFSQGVLEGNIFTIHATTYKAFADGHEGIALTISGKKDTDEGDYNLSMHIKEVTDGLDFPKELLNADFQICYILPPPPPLWKRILVPVIVLVLLVLIVLFVLHVTAKFPKGILQFGHEEVRLKGKKRVSAKEELEKMDIMLPEGTDIIFIKKRFATFSGPCVKAIKNCSLEREGSYLTRGSVIRLEEEIRGLTDVNGNELLIRYCY